MGSKIGVLNRILEATGAGLAIALTRPSLTYLTQTPIPPTYERPILLAYTREEHVLIAPLLEKPRLEGLGLPTVFYRDGEDPLRTTPLLAPGRFDTVVMDHGVPHKLYVRTWEALGRPRDRGPLEDHLATHRKSKDKDEVSRIKKAVGIIEDIYRKLERKLAPGMSEAEASLHILKEALEKGAEEVAFAAVASGPNSALPHHERGPRLLQRGDVVVVDIVVSWKGYYGDLTRVYVLGESPQGFSKAFKAVQEAREAALSKARPGRPAGELDRAASRVLRGWGFGDNILHRTGHGLGVEVHEPPFIAEGNSEPLGEGNVFTVEPGLYFGGRFGVRLESTVVIQGGEAVLLDSWGLEPIFL